MPWLIDAANLGGALGGAAGARNTKAILAALLPWARERPQVVVHPVGRADVEVLADLAQRWWKATLCDGS